MATEAQDKTRAGERRVIVSVTPFGVRTSVGRVAANGSRSPPSNRFARLAFETDDAPFHADFPEQAPRRPTTARAGA